MKKLLCFVLLAGLLMTVFTGCLGDKVSEEFKAKMDAYEEDADKLVECKKKLDENPEDLELYAEFAELMVKNELNMAELEAMNEEEMEAVEKAYYLKVQTSVSTKVAKILADAAKEAG